jgi:hypothetical protein
MALEGGEGRNYGEILLQRGAEGADNERWSVVAVSSVRFDDAPAFLSGLVRARVHWEADAYVSFLILYCSTPVVS